MENQNVYKKRDFRPILKRGEIIRFIKVREVKTPEYSTKGSVGLDFYVPMDFKSQTIKPNQSVLIPSGIKMRLPKGVALIAFNKSGVAIKKSLIKGAEIIDFDYFGEIHIHVINVGEKEVTINPNDKLIQFILMPIIIAKLFEVKTEEELFPYKSERGEGGFGSTDYQLEWQHKGNYEKESSIDEQWEYYNEDKELMNTLRIIGFENEEGKKKLKAIFTYKINNEFKEKEFIYNNDSKEILEIKFGIKI